MQPFYQHLDSAVRQFEHLQYRRHATGFIEILGRGVVLGRRFLRDQQNVLATFHRDFKCLDGLRTPDEQRNHHVREYHHVAQRQQRIAQRFVAIV